MDRIFRKMKMLLIAAISIFVSSWSRDGALIVLIVLCLGVLIDWDVLRSEQKEKEEPIK